MDPVIQKLSRVDARSAWNKEHQFSVWLADNIDHLSDALGIRINIEKIEKEVGPFSVDLYGDDGNGNKLIIENQLEKTDHDHLGKILTYSVNLEAKVIIWITTKPIEQHSNVIDWLNENTPEDIAIFLVKIELVQIEGSTAMAPLFTVVNRPTHELKSIGQANKDFTARNYLNKEFWTGLLEKENEITDLHSRISPGYYNWIGASAGLTGIGYNYSVQNKLASCEIYLDHRDGPEVNKRRFDELFRHKDAIESEFGELLKWERLDKKKACRISHWIKKGLLVFVNK